MQTGQQARQSLVVQEHHLLEKVFNSFHKSTDMSSQERKQIMSLHEYVNGLISVDAMKKQQAQQQASAKIQSDLKEFEEIKSETKELESKELEASQDISENEDTNIKTLPKKTKRSPRTN